MPHIFKFLIARVRFVIVLSKSKSAVYVEMPLAVLTCLSAISFRVPPKFEILSNMEVKSSLFKRLLTSISAYSYNSSVLFSFHFEMTYSKSSSFVVGCASVMGAGVAVAVGVASVVGAGVSVAVGVVSSIGDGVFVVVVSDSGVLALHPEEK